VVAQFFEKLPGLTSEVTAFVVFAVGVLCFKGEYQLSATLSVLTLFVLSFREQMHDFVKHLTLQDLFAFLKFATVTVIVYPLLPDRAFYGVNPREVWMMVMVISTIDFLGYVLTKVVGEKGVLLTGLIGGLVSSTAVTATFSPLAKSNPALTAEYAAGIVGASAIMFPRMTFLAAIVNLNFAKFLFVPSLVAFLFGTAFAYRVSKREENRTSVEVRNPYELSTAVKFGLFYAFILFLSRNAIERFGDYGLYAVAALSGLSDVDAITLSVSKLFSNGEVALLAGVIAVLLSSTVNTVFKWFLTVSMGTEELFRKVTPGFVALLAGEVLGVMLLFFFLSRS